MLREDTIFSDQRRYIRDSPQANQIQEIFGKMRGPVVKSFHKLIGEPDTRKVLKGISAIALQRIYYSVSGGNFRVQDLMVIGDDDIYL